MSTGYLFNAGPGRFPAPTVMSRLHRPSLSTAVAWVLIALVTLASVFFFREAKDVIGKPFSGFLTFENRMVGAFSGFDWPGYEAGLRYHDIVLSTQVSGTSRRYEIQRNSEATAVEVAGGTFELKDFLVAFFAPYASGMAYVLLSIVLLVVGRRMRGIVPFVCFNLGIAYYLLASFDFHFSHHASWLFLLIFAALPAFMSHFALVFPEEPAAVRRRPWIVLVPYLFSAALYFPYVTSFYRDPASWILWERVVVAYVILSYLFWIAMLAFGARRAVHETGRIAATYLLFGQLIAFLIPLTASVAIFLFGRNVPLNLIAPVTVVLPIASLFGIVLGNLRAAQLTLVQSEKMASLGNLVAGVAHEINNPTTFIYSNLPMLREYVGYLKGAIRADAVPYRGEMKAPEVAEDLGRMVETIADGAGRIKAIVGDLRRFGHSQDDVAGRIEIRPGIESTANLLAHDLKERITLHLDVPKDLAITANGGQMGQVWMNLLSNALDAIEGEGNVWVHGTVDRGCVRVSVRDDGRGIPAKMLSRIFDPFFTTKPEGKGTGLGLAICQQIVHRWGGEITVHSEKGHGTAIEVSFPQQMEAPR